MDITNKNEAYGGPTVATAIWSSVGFLASVNTLDLLHDSDIIIDTFFMLNKNGLNLKYDMTL